MRKAGLTLNLKKCVFAKGEVDYLGHHVGLGKVQPIEKKVEALMNFLRPTTRKQLQSFLGLASYYRKYIPHFASLSAVYCPICCGKIRNLNGPKRLNKRSSISNRD